MAGKILALMGRVSRAETGRVLDMDFSDWTLRKDDPRGRGRRVSGKRDRKRHSFVLACASLADLERAGLLLAHEGFAEQVVVYLRRTARPERLRLEIADFREMCTVVSEFAPNGSLVVRASASEAAIDIGAFVLSLVRSSTGRTRGLRVLVQDDSQLALLGLGAKFGVGGGAIPSGGDSIPPFDIFVTTSASPESEDGSGGTDNAVQGSWDLPEVPVAMEQMMPLNVAWTSPIGFLSEPPLDNGILRLTRDGAGRHIASLEVSAGSSVHHDVSNLVSENLVGDLRPYRRVELSGCADSDRFVVAKLVTALVGSGIPVTGIDGKLPVPSTVENRLADLERTELDCDVQRALWSSDTRREVLAKHSQDAVRERLAGDVKYPIAPAETVSVVIASSRPQLVSSILRQVQSQKYPAFEIILGLHGYSRGDLLRIDPAAVDFLNGVTLREVGAEMLLGEVLARLSQTAAGDLLAKMDDDDLYTHHHIGDLVAAQHYSQAELVGCKAEFVYLEEHDLTIQRRANSERFGASVTGGSILLSKEALRAAGGWSPVQTAEDRLLQEGIQRAGGRVYRSHGGNYLMSRGDGKRDHTFQPRHRYFADQAIREWHGIGYPGWHTSGSDK